MKKRAEWPVELELEWVDRMSEEERLALEQAIASEIEGESPAISQRHKRRMNRIFRRAGGMSCLVYPEADTPCERLRAHMLLLLRAKQR